MMRFWWLPVFQLEFCGLIALVLNCLEGTVVITAPPVKVVVELSVFAVHKPCDGTEYDIVWDKKYTWLIVSDSGWVPSSRNKYSHYFEHARMCLWRGSLTHSTGNLIDLLAKYINHAN